MTTTPSPSADIGVFGGSGFYAFLDGVEQIEIETPYGEPSSPVMLGEVEGRGVAFLPRHGLAHQFPPHASVSVFRTHAWI